MKTLSKILLLGVLTMAVCSLSLAQTYTRKMVNVPKVDPSAITIDGKMNEAAWQNAAHADMVTKKGFEIFTYPYYRPNQKEPDYDSLFARMLWAKDTLYVFVYTDMKVNDSTGLYWNGQWTGDQLFVSLSNRLGVEMKGWYDGNVYAAPDGPYHFLILGDTISLNLGKKTNIPTEYRRFPADTQRVFKASDIARWATTINKTTGVWTVEMAIYNPHVNAGSRVGFNVGGSTGSFTSDTAHHDAYAYWTWQPSVVDSPYAQPKGVPIPTWGTDPGYYNLASSLAWALLEFSTSTGPLGVERIESRAIPSEYVLAQNYPNPFNPTTKINYDVKKAARMQLIVFNVLGQQVATIVDAVQPVGRYKATWDASRLVSGVYFYQLRADNAILDTKKMIFLK